MNKLGNLELKVVRFASQDVIATSFYVIPYSQYHDDVYGSFDYADYVLMEGEQLYYSDAEKGWAIASYPYYGFDADEYQDLKNNPGSFGYNRYSIYDAYQGSDGYYYTKGASYGELSGQ
ncbi:MAG: hypothetical protein IKZ47_04220 [Clostridia bacterium]|nr:hypothetical protein [Clostridia bacterium]